MLRLGLPVIYRPRVPYGRQHELFGFITRIIDAEKATVDLITFPTNSETVHYNNVAPKSDGTKVHCWESDGGEFEACKSQLFKVEGEAALLRAELDAAKAAISDLTARIKTLEKRGARAAES